MAAQYPYIMEAIDVRRATQPDSSRRRIIKTMALPALTRITAELMAGGSIGNINLSYPQIEALEPKFATHGPDLDVLSNFGLTPGNEMDRWVFAGSMRIRRSAAPVPARAIIEGVVNSWEPDENTPGELMGCNHTLAEVTHYELIIDGKEYIYFDDDENVARSGGVDWFAGTRRALGI
ncbi:MAG: phage major tail tube protein [Methylobacterium sp.]|uniref:phage major tail tube protein n=1 Tax=Methylobacterium sp. TaxID=409 RepID=UPI00271DBA44|nr:phage major tail tube protein [Methylobacterium sp.]MDO9428456.1 phage major tail tube protein [Methylobacterium sp.]